MLDQKYLVGQQNTSATTTISRVPASEEQDIQTEEIGLGGSPLKVPEKVAEGNEQLEQKWEHEKNRKKKMLRE